MFLKRRTKDEFRQVGVRRRTKSEELKVHDTGVCWRSKSAIRTTPAIAEGVSDSFCWSECPCGTRRLVLLAARATDRSSHYFLFELFIGRAVARNTIMRHGVRDCRVTEFRFGHLPVLRKRATEETTPVAAAQPDASGQVPAVPHTRTSLNGMVCRRSLEVVECSGKEASHETTSARH
jgi:hypothetical protein